MMPKPAGYGDDPTGNGDDISFANLYRQDRCGFTLTDGGGTAQTARLISPFFSPLLSR
jgi:hypothetical protein